MLRLTCLALALAASSAFTAPGATQLVAPAQRTAAPTMQFFNPKKDARTPAPPPAKRGRRGSNEFFDDERDTVSRDEWTPDFAENGEVDLANVGGVYYLAFVPFLLFAISYLFGAVGSPYSRGNF